MTTTCGPNGLALTIVIIGIVRASWTMALNSRTSEGSISGRTLTITEQRVKNIPETAARKIPRRTDEGLHCHFCSDFQRLNEGVYTTYHPIATVIFWCSICALVIRVRPSWQTSCPAVSTATARSTAAIIKDWLLLTSDRSYLFFNFSTRGKTYHHIFPKAHMASN